MVPQKQIVRFLQAAFFLIAFAAAADADYRFELGNKQNKITVLGIKEGLRVQVQSTQAFSTEVFALEGPSRIVLDIYGLKLKSHQSPKIPRNKLIKGIRMALSAGKIRIVLDLKPVKIPEYSTSQQGNEFILSINEISDILKLQKSEEPVATPAPVAETPVSAESVGSAVVTLEVPGVPVITPTPELVPSPVPTAPPAEPTLEVLPEPSVQAEVPAADGALVLKGLVFDNGVDVALRLQLSMESGFRLTREKDFYLLTVNECGVSGRHLLLPHYAPEGFSGINVVKPDIEGQNLLVRLYVPRTVRLSAFRNGNEIWIRSAQKNPL